MLVRTDLPLAQQLCQAVHAAHEAGIRHGNPEVVSSVVVCAVPNERALLEARERLDHRGIQSYLFREDGDTITPPTEYDQATALATEPLEHQRRKILSNYPLWKEPRSMAVS